MTILEALTELYNAVPGDCDWQEDSLKDAMMDAARIVENDSSRVEPIEVLTNLYDELKSHNWQWAEMKNALRNAKKVLREQAVNY